MLKLPNGCQVDPKSVTEINSLGDTVTVVAGGAVFKVTCVSPEAAAVMRDQLAKQMQQAAAIRFEVAAFKHDVDGEVGDMFHHKEMGWSAILVPSIKGKTFGTALPVQLPVGMKLIRVSQAREDQN